MCIPYVYDVGVCMRLCIFDVLYLMLTVCAPVHIYEFRIKHANNTKSMARPIGKII